MRLIPFVRRAEIAQGSTELQALSHEGAPASSTTSATRLRTTSMVRRSEQSRVLHWGLVGVVRKEPRNGFSV